MGCLLFLITITFYANIYNHAVSVVIAAKPGQASARNDVLINTSREAFTIGQGQCFGGIVIALSPTLALKLDGVEGTYDLHAVLAALPRLSFVYVALFWVPEDVPLGNYRVIAIEGVTMPHKIPIVNQTGSPIEIRIRHTCDTSSVNGERLEPFVYRSLLSPR